MLIDIIYLILVLIAIFKGIQRGFIIAVFSVISLIIGLVAAIKLSSIVAIYLNDSANISARWLPFISFIIVFLLVVIMVRLGASVLSKTLDTALLGWLNRLAGVLLYFLLYTIVFSVILFFIVQMHLVKQDTLSQSRMYTWIEPVGPFVIDRLGMIVPFFADMFRDLNAFFEEAAKQLPEK